MVVALFGVVEAQLIKMKLDKQGKLMVLVVEEDKMKMPLIEPVEMDTLE